MKIAIPLTNNTLSEHFGHCEEFAIYELSEDSTAILSETRQTPPPHEPGVFPAWLKSLGVNHIVAGGMGRRALDLFEENGITVVAGETGLAPDSIIKALQANSLGTDKPSCNHKHGDEHNCA